MERPPSDMMRRELDAALSRINAAEASGGAMQAGDARMMRALAEAQLHSLAEIEHLKKAVDLLTQMLFEKRI